MCWGHAINPDLNTRLYTLLFFPFLFWYDYFQETRPSQRTGPVIFKAKEKLILSFNCIKSAVIEILPHCWVRHGLRAVCDRTNQRPFSVNTSSNFCFMRHVFKKEFMVYAPCKPVLAGKFLRSVTMFPCWFLHSSMGHCHNNKNH